MTKFYKALAGSAALCALTTGTAFAGGTAPGVDVQNTFTLNYSVDSTPQDEINNNGTPTEFTVDRLVDLTVANEGAASVNVPAGGQDREILFSVTNDGNDSHDYALTAAVESTTMVDNNNVSAPPTLTVRYYVDDGDGIFQDDGTDGTLQNYDPSDPPTLAPDRVLWVVVEGDFNSQIDDGQEAVVSLTADTLDLNSTTPTLDDSDDDGVNQLNAVDNVLADGAGTDDAANEGDHSARGTYTVATATVNATKAVAVINQFPATPAACGVFPGTAGTGEQYYVPGACVEYTIEVVNSGGASATDISINDDLSNKPLIFIAVNSTGFTGGDFETGPRTLPASEQDCSGANTCDITFDTATLPAATTGQVIIRALVKNTP